MPTAVVTGASRGLGRALTTALADAGWTVVVDGRSLTGDAFAPNPAVIAVPGDVTDSWHRALLIETALETGRLDLLVNNAGILGLSIPRNRGGFRYAALPSRASVMKRS